MPFGLPRFLKSGMIRGKKERHCRLLFQSLWSFCYLAAVRVGRKKQARNLNISFGNNRHYCMHDTQRGVDDLAQQGCLNRSLLEAYFPTWSHLLASSHSVRVFESTWAIECQYFLPIDRLTTLSC
ncbi:hypothetical protein BJY04DRAFT_177404 [Aspergillus karnatakaensis]|uniref:uncharacterized protein n=1 Tax=Aspergillus karnatakaensis TaxID=1810916 RepID=UPI003CCD6CB1